MTTQKQPNGLKAKLSDVPSPDAKRRRGRPVVVGKVNLLLVLLAFLVLAGTY
jgi:hypothetical protein